MKSPKQQSFEADRRLMADIIKRSRARSARMTAGEKARIVRRLEDGAAEAANAVRAGYDLFPDAPRMTRKKEKRR
jgi:hypothetical protein